MPKTETRTKAAPSARPVTRNAQMAAVMRAALEAAKEQSLDEFRERVWKTELTPEEIDRACEVGPSSFAAYVSPGGRLAGLFEVMPELRSGHNRAAVLLAAEALVVALSSEGLERQLARVWAFQQRAEAAIEDLLRDRERPLVEEWLKSAPAELERSGAAAGFDDTIKSVRQMLLNGEMNSRKRVIISLALACFDLVCRRGTADAERGTILGRSREAFREMKLEDSWTWLVQRLAQPVAVTEEDLARIRGVVALVQAAPLRLSASRVGPADAKSQDPQALVVELSADGDGLATIGGMQFKAFAKGRHGKAIKTTIPRVRRHWLALIAIAKNEDFKLNAQEVRATNSWLTNSGVKHVEIEAPGADEKVAASVRLKQPEHGAVRLKLAEGFDP